MRTTSSAALAAGQGSGPADLQLVRRALRGEGPAVEELLVRLSCVVRFVFRMNRSLAYGLPPEALEDAVQQVYVAVWPRLSRFSGAASIESWVFGFCRNCVRAEARKRSHRLRLVQPNSDRGDDVAAREPSDPDAGPDSRCVRGERIDALRDELERLAADERVIVELRWLEDWSFERIAEHLEVPASTVKDRCYRALSKMKGRLGRRDVGA